MFDHQISWGEERHFMMNQSKEFLQFEVQGKLRQSLDWQISDFDFLVSFGG
jgi:hypothetical protein